MRMKSIGATLLCCTAATLCSASAQIELTMLSDLVDCECHSGAGYVSPNGDWVSLATRDPDTDALFVRVWSEESGMIFGGALSGPAPFALPRAIANNGVVVGVSRRDTSGRHWQGFVWSPEQGMQALVGINNASHGSAEGVSADGRIIVGYSSFAFYGALTYWVDGVPTAIDFLPGGFNAGITDISGDGRTFVGFGDIDLDGVGDGVMAYRWTANDGFTFLGDTAPLVWQVPDWVRSSAEVISGDGRVIYGYDRDHALFRWTAEDGIVRMLDASYGINVGDTNGDGSIVTFGAVGAIWSACGGLRNFEIMLREEGVSIDPGLELFYPGGCQRMAPDWRAVLPFRRDVAATVRR